MTKNVVFKLVVLEDDKQVLSKNLSYEIVSNIVSNFPDNAENNDLFGLAARHPAAVVREYVAGKDTLSEETLNVLSADSSIAVLRNLVRTNAFKEHASAELIEKLVGTDIEIAQTVAGDIDSYQSADTGKLYSLFSSHNDPSVVATLAGGYNVPKKVLKNLINHPDPYVVSEAKVRLDD